MIRARLISQNETREGGYELVGEWDKDSTSMLWLDINGETLERESTLFAEFEIPSLAVADIQRVRHPPKFERLPNCLFFLMRGLHEQTNSIDFQTISIAVLLGERFVLTRANGKSPSINKAWDMTVNNAASSWGSTEEIAYRVLRNVSERFVPILMNLEERLEEIEDEIVTAPSDKLLAELLAYSRQLKKLRRISRYHEALTLSASSADGHHVVLQAEYRDLNEQFERIASLSNLYHEQTSDLINGYISVASHHLNQIMRVLTIVTVIIAPLSVMVGIFGMNFEYMPELKWRYGYFIALGVMSTIAISLALLFKRRGWL
jgi:magnesium transporter